MTPAFLIAALLTTAGSANPPASTLTVITTEDGAPAVSYQSIHHLRCGGSDFSISIDSPKPVRLTSLTVDGKPLSATVLESINSTLPRTSWFKEVVSSCTTRGQSLTLILSTDSSYVTVPLEFENGNFTNAGEYSR